MPIVSFLTLLSCSTVVIAGGLWEAANIVNIITTSETDYILDIEFASEGVDKLSPQDPMFHGCTQLKIHGTFSTLRAKGQLAWLFPSPKHEDLTKANHLRAVAYLKQSAIKHRMINFGYMGTGFLQINSNQPCVVASRALEFYDYKDTTAVISYYNDY